MQYIVYCIQYLQYTITISNVHVYTPGKKNSQHNINTIMITFMVALCDKPVTSYLSAKFYFFIAISVLKCTINQYQNIRFPISISTTITVNIGLKMVLSSLAIRLFC